MTIKSFLCKVLQSPECHSVWDFILPLYWLWKMIGTWVKILDFEFQQTWILNLSLFIYHIHGFVLVKCLNLLISPQFNCFIWKTEKRKNVNLIEIVWTQGDNMIFKGLLPYFWHWKCSIHTITVCFFCIFKSEN